MLAFYLHLTTLSSTQQYRILLSHRRSLQHFFQILHNLLTEFRGSFFSIFSQYICFTQQTLNYYCLLVMFLFRRSFKEPFHNLLSFSFHSIAIFLLHSIWTAWCYFRLTAQGRSLLFLVSLCLYLFLSISPSFHGIRLALLSTFFSPP